MMRILNISAECAPFIKTGGLGTVVGAVPKALCKKGYDVRVVLPLYECIPEVYKEKMTKLLDYPVRLGWRMQPASLWQLEYDGVQHYFIGNTFYFSGAKPYAEIWQDIEKFSFFCKAVLELFAYYDYRPDIIHCHDWHTAMLPVYLRTEYGHDPLYQSIRTVMTIHNLKFQGIMEAEPFKDITGLPDYMLSYDKLGDNGCGNMLKGGLTYADKITTVSETYAREIMEPEYGEGLDAVLAWRRDDIIGIVNGIDTDVYDPSRDDLIAKKYDISNYRRAKKGNKKALQKETGMPEDENAFTIAIISRLTTQKGFDLLAPLFEDIFSSNLQLYVLGAGEEAVMQIFSEAVKKYPDKLFIDFNYTDRLAKMMYAGCDAVLMPSLFEPCGLCQMMAFRYGTPPIARLTGGLVDTIKPYHIKKSQATGFAFTDYSPEALLATIKEAENICQEKPRTYSAIQKRCMLEDYSWDKQSEEYVKLYESIHKY